MSNNTAYDITGEIDPIKRLDDIQSRLEKRRQQRNKTANAKSTNPEASAGEGEAKPPANPEAGKEAAAKKRAADAVKKRRKEENQRQAERQKELAESRWITAGHKVREKRVEHLERVYYRLKAEGEFTGNKQEFFDEGLAMLQDKYAEVKQ